MPAAFRLYLTSTLNPHLFFVSKSLLPLEGRRPTQTTRANTAMIADEFTYDSVSGVGIDNGYNKYAVGYDDIDFSDLDFGE